MSVISKIKTLIWFLKNPSYYGQLFKLISQKISGDPREDSRAESESWCNERAISTEEFLKDKTGQDLQPLKDLYPEKFSHAFQMAEESPVKMGGPGNIELVYFLSEHLQATSVVETGVAYGWTTLSLLLSLNKREGSRLFSIDMPYAKMGNEDYVGCVVHDDLRSPWTLIRKPDQSGLEPALKELGTLDLCHYDSDKTYNGRMWAYPRLWEKIRSGGYFVSDDIGDNVAFRDFCKQIDQEPVVLKYGQQYVGILSK